MFYGYEKTFKSIEHLEQAIADYINYYNNKRIKVKPKGLSPVQDLYWPQKVRQLIYPKDLVLYCTGLSPFLPFVKHVKAFDKK